MTPLICNGSPLGGFQEGMLHVQADKAACQLRPLALEDTSGMCAAWLAATAAEAQPALGQLLGSCATSEVLAAAEAALRAALSAWRHLPPAQEPARGVPYPPQIGSSRSRMSLLTVIRSGPPGKTGPL